MLMEVVDSCACPNCAGDVLKGRKDEGEDYKLFVDCEACGQLGYEWVRVDDYSERREREKEIVERFAA